MCDPDDTAPKDEPLCDDIWETLCGPTVEQPVDDDFCDWIGYTEDVVVEWANSEDYEAGYDKIMFKEKSDKKSDKKVSAFG